MRDDVLRPDGDAALALRLAAVADRVALSFFGRRVASWRKADGSPATEADVAVERALVTILRNERPDDAILTEEAGEIGHGLRRWILDPIDGTVPFLAGKRNWGAHVTLEVNHLPILGVITRPTERRRWWAFRGRGAYTDDPLAHRKVQPLAVSTTGDLRAGRVSGLVEPGNPAARALAQYCTWVDDVCVVGALAEGRVDAVVDDGGKIWDIAPAVVIVTEAGGTFHDFWGGTRYERGGGLYTNGLVEPQVRQVIASTGIALAIGPSPE
jgi:histidinol-phosphatase